MAERFPNESEADACQRLTKSQELLYEMKASELRYYRLLDECEELRTQRMFQAAQHKRVLGLRALSQSKDFYLQHLKLLLKGELNGYRDDDSAPGEELRRGASHGRRADDCARPAHLDGPECAIPLQFIAVAGSRVQPAGCRRKRTLKDAIGGRSDPHAQAKRYGGYISSLAVRTSTSATSGCAVPVTAPSCRRTSMQNCSRTWLGLGLG